MVREPEGGHHASLLVLLSGEPLGKGSMIQGDYRLKGGPREAVGPGSGIPASAKPFSRRMQLSQVRQGRPCGVGS